MCHTIFCISCTCSVNNEINADGVIRQEKIIVCFKCDFNRKADRNRSVVDFFSVSQDIPNSKSQDASDVEIKFKDDEEEEEDSEEDFEFDQQGEEEKQSGSESVMFKETFKDTEIDADDMFMNLDANIDDYKISDRNEEGTIHVKIGTTYQKSKKVFGAKYNFELTIDINSKSGLKGLPPLIESQIMQSFTKQEVMTDPEKVL